MRKKLIRNCPAFTFDLPDALGLKVDIIFI